MKKGISMLLVIVMSMLLFTGCGGQSSQSPEPDKDQAPDSGAAAQGTDEKSVYDTLNIIVAHGGAETMSMHKGWLKFEELVEGRSGGAVTIDIYPNQQMGGDREYTEACMMGNVTMGSPSSAPVAAFVPEVNVFESPFIFADRDAAYAALDGEAGQSILDALEACNLKGLGYFENGFRELTTNKEIAVKDDLKGLKIRTMENDVHLAVWKALGANPSPLAFGELYTALQQKTFDAQENPLETIYNTKFYEVQSHVYMTNHIYTPYIVFMNLDIWNGLNSETQELIQTCLREAIDYQRQLSAEAEKECTDAINGTSKSQVSEISDELRQELVSACADVYDMIKGLAGKEITENFYRAAGFQG